MAMSKKQRTLKREAEQIASEVGLNLLTISTNAKEKSLAYQAAINKMVLACVVEHYTLLDDALSDLICRYYFRRAKSLGHFGPLWKTDLFRVFVNYILDEMYLLKKMEVAHALDPLPSKVRNTLQKVNAVRNALAHSFFPENRKEYAKTKKIIYSGEDLRTCDGLKLFQQEARAAFDFIIGRQLKARGLVRQLDDGSIASFP